MKDKDTDLDLEEIDKSQENNFSFNVFFTEQFSKVKSDPRHFLYQILSLIIPIYIYYLVADEFVRQSLLNLTKGRIEGLDLPFIILDDAVDPFTTYVTAFISDAYINDLNNEQFAETIEMIKKKDDSDFYYRDVTQNIIDGGEIELGGAP